MHERISKNVVHIDQPAADKFREGVMLELLRLMNEDTKFTLEQKLQAAYGAILDIAFEVDVLAYRDFLLAVDKANTKMLDDIREGFGMAGVDP